MGREERVSAERCTLCKLPSKVYCESDKASLCWDCDALIHGANFLVERHARTLLCGSCSRPTAWKATGCRLGQAVSPCDRCSGRKIGDVYREEVSEVSKKSDDGENQVVPWGLMVTPPPPPTESFSSSSFNDMDGSSLTRERSRREIFDLNLSPEIDFSVNME